jgi:hypothetical protein
MDETDREKLSLGGLTKWFLIESITQKENLSVKERLTRFLMLQLFTTA